MEMAGSHSAVLNDAVRCSGAAANGSRCRVTSMMDMSSAEPLRTGGQFCTWHLSQCPSAAGSVPTSADEDRSSSPMSLSQEQLTRVALNRKHAFELRRQRCLRKDRLTTSRPVEPPAPMLRMSSTETLQKCEQHSSQGRTPAASTVASANKDVPERPRSSSPMSLSHEQRTRLESNKKRALDIRRQKRLREEVSPESRLATKAVEPFSWSQEWHGATSREWAGALVAQPQALLDSAPATPARWSRSPSCPPRHLSVSLTDPPLPQIHLRRLSTPSLPNPTVEAKLGLPVSLDDDDETIGADPDELAFAEDAQQQSCEEQDWFDVDNIW